VTGWVGDSASGADNLFLAAQGAPSETGRAIIIRPALRDWRIGFQGLFAALKKCVFFHLCFAMKEQESHRVNEPFSNTADFPRS
jgi:hypothetical protein